jgi:hypothetical protein
MSHGWAIGLSSAMFPAGVFVSESGGRSWSSTAGADSTGWQAGDFLEPYIGAVASQDGRAAAIRRGTTTPSQPPDFGLRGLARLQLVAPRFGWLIGQGGLLMITRDLGGSWQTPSAGLPEGAAAEFDFAALAVRDTRVWVAGSPGTRVFHTADAGLAWVAHETGQNLPLCGLHFVDDSNGWAVGELGTILATHDGGKSWSRQRSGGTRAALLGIFSEPEDVPLELFAQLSGNEGYLGIVELLDRRDLEAAATSEVSAADRVREAMAGVGASGARTAWRFPLRQKGLELPAEKILDDWDRANDGRAVQERRAHLVRQIRLWRPEVVVTHDMDVRGNDPLAQLIHQAVLEAVEAAADPTLFSEQITQAGLGPWKVKKVFAAVEPGIRGDCNLTASGLATRLGRSLEEVTAGPRGLIDSESRPVPETFGFRLLADHLDPGSRRDDFFTGIVLQPGGEARRQLIEPSSQSVELIQRIAQRRRNSRAILQHMDDDPRQGAGLLAQVGDLVEGLDKDASARLLDQLARGYYRSGQWAMAAETFQLLADRHEDHPLARAALGWLVAYHASSEAAWRQYGGQRRGVQQVSATEPDPLDRRGVPQFAVRRASAPSLDAFDLDNHPQQAVELAKRIEQTRPDLYAEPAIGFPLAVVQRQRGFSGEAEKFYLLQSRSRGRDAWRASAMGEQWLSEPKGLPPKPMLKCVAARGKPRLDGRLNEAFWERAKPAELKSPRGDDADWPGSVMMAYDEEFLYLAVDCRRAPGAKYPAGEGPRPRDADLSAQDRVEIYLDLDRDYTTYFRFTVDHRGWTGEGCWGDSTWNPTWFVAAGPADDNRWTVEAAIPLEQLTGQYPTSRAAWALGIQRIVPGVGFQSWNRPAATAVRPEGFGYLLFE